jgi:hypothetical protein
MKWMRLGCLVGLAALPLAARGQVVISQIYSAGGNAGATWTNDYIELYNKGAAPVNLAGWAVQYASAAGTSWNPDEITAGTIQPGGYFLIQLASQAAVGSPLPSPDFISTGTPSLGIINMAAGAGKIALTNTNTQLPATTCTGTIPSNPAIVDFVGWGTTASCYEGSGSAASPSNNQSSMFRGTNGCADSNNNAADFSVASAVPRNSGSPTFTCPASTNPSGVGATSPTDVCPGTSVVISITVTPGQFPTSTGITVTGNMDPIDPGAGGQAFFNDGTNGDAVANDNIWTRTEPVFVSPGFPTLNCTVSDAQGRSGAVSVTVHVINCGPSGFFTANPSGLCPGENTLLVCTTTPGQQPPSTGISVTADLSAANGSATQQLFDDGSNGDVTAGDGTFSFLFTPAGATDGGHALHAVVSDLEGRASNQLDTSLTTAGSCTNSSSTVVISQVYGGGGNAGATLTNDFIELFNRGTTAVDITGWSVQYASGRDDIVSGFGVPADRITTLSGTIQPGHYYLIQEAAGAGGTDPLPTPDTTGGIAMGLNRGAIALVRNSNAVGLNCASTDIADMVGYGNGTTPATQGFCNEGAFLAPTLTNTTAASRRDGGCHDVDNNGVDFNVGAPAPRNSATPEHLCAAPPRCCLNDYNGDGDVGTDADIEAFFSCLGGTCCATCPPNADFNCDGDVGTDGDIEAFFRVLAGGQC